MSIRAVEERGGVKNLNHSSICGCPRSSGERFAALTFALDLDVGVFARRHNGPANVVQREAPHRELATIGGFHQAGIGERVVGLVASHDQLKSGCVGVDHASTGIVDCHVDAAGALLGSSTDSTASRGLR